MNWLIWLVQNLDWLLTGAAAVFIGWIFYRRSVEEKKQRQTP